MDSIAKKLQLLNCPPTPSMYQRAYKHIASLELIGYDELEQILRLLLTKKIIIPKNGEILVSPENFCVLANGFDIIKSRIEEMEKIGELQAYREKLNRINSKSAIDHLSKMKEKGELYKTPDGKYSKVPFSVRRFKNKFAVKEVTKEKVIKEVKPVVEEIKQPEEPLISSIFASILSEPQDQALTDETFSRFEKLSDNLQRVIFTVYGVNEVNDKITDNLIKLITSKKSPLDDQEDIDAELLFTAITYGKSISDIEKQRLMDCIMEELQNDTDIELGRAA